MEVYALYSRFSLAAIAFLTFPHAVAHSCHASSTRSKLKDALPSLIRLRDMFAQQKPARKHAQTETWRDGAWVVPLWAFSTFLAYDLCSNGPRACLTFSHVELYAVNTCSKWTVHTFVGGFQESASETAHSHISLNTARFKEGLGLMLRSFFFTLICRDSQDWNGAILEKLRLSMDVQLEVSSGCLDDANLKENWHLSDKPVAAVCLGVSLNCSSFHKGEGVQLHKLPFQWEIFFFFLQWSSG